MAKGKIGYIYDGQSREIKLPITSVEAVLDEHGRNVSELISDVQPTLTTLIIDTSAGLTLSSGTNKLSVRAMRNGEDITAHCDERDFTWTRCEGEWLREGEKGKSITLGSSDLVKEKATFVCTLSKQVSDTVSWNAMSAVTIDGSVSDNINLIGYIQSSLSIIVVRHGDTLFPDWSVTPLILTPVLHKTGNDSNLAQSRLLSKTWLRRINGNRTWTKVTSGQAGELINSQTGVLTVSRNKLTDQALTCEYKFQCKYYDNETDKTLDYEMYICFAAVKDGVDGVNGQDGANGTNGTDGANGIGIKSVVQTKKSTEDDGENEWTVIKDNLDISKFYVKNGSKGSKGVDGTNGWTRAVVSLYRRSTRPLTRADIDFGTLTYDVATNSFLEISGGQIGQWFTSTISGSNSLYTTFVVIHTQDAQVTVVPSNWSTPVVLSEIGSSGQTGETIAYVTLYQRAEETPELPYNNVTFNFITHTITQPKGESGEDLPWTLTAPANDGHTLWSTTAVAQGRDDYDVIAPSEWTAPVELVKNGTDGRDGVDGQDGQNGTDGADGADGADGRDGRDGTDGIDGQDGLSAYQIAVEHGYEGTEEQWLLDMHTEMRFQYAVVAGDYDCMRSYGPGLDEAFGYIDGVGYGLDVAWSDEVPLNVPEGSFVWLRAKNTSTNVWQYVRLTGKPGTSAGFGEPSISITSETGTPTAEVTASGPDSAKVFHFTFNNLKGNGIDSITEHWAVTATQTEPAPEEVIETDVPEMTPVLRWLWKKTTVAYTDGTSQDFVDLACIYGEKGNPGADITIANIKYGVSASPATLPEEWTSNIPSVPQGAWLWTQTTYSDSTVSRSYAYQPKDLDLDNIVMQYALSNSPDTLSGVIEWKSSVAQDWRKGKYFWSREVRYYANGTSSTGDPQYEAELTAEFEERCEFTIRFDRRTYDGTVNSLIPMDISSKHYVGTLSMTVNQGTFQYYDVEMSRWVTLGERMALEIRDGARFTNYALRLPAGTVNIVYLFAEFEAWNSETMDFTESIYPAGV